MKAVVVLADGFEEIEAVTPIDLLRRAGVDVTVAGLDRLDPAGARGITLRCDALLADLPRDWDALVLPGGAPGAQRLAVSALVDELVQHTLDSGKLLAAICASPAVVLGRRGYLKGRAYTGYPGAGTAADVEGAFRREDDVVDDGNLITSRGVGTAAAFGLALVDRLAGADRRDEVARATLLT